MKDWLTGDWGVKLGALFLATGLWLHAVTEHSYRRELDIRLLVDDPQPAGESALVVASELPATARIAVFGDGKDLLRLDESDFVLHLQSELSPGGRATIRPSPDQVEDHSELNLVVESVIRPREVTVALDRLETRKVPIEPATVLEAANSFTIVGHVALKPDSVTISGPLHLVQAIHLIHTDTLTLTGLSGPVELDVQLAQPSTNLLHLDHQVTTLIADIQELAEYEVGNVPVRVEGRPGAAAAPSRVTVKVRGGADLIGSLDPETDLGLYVDLRTASGANEAGELVLSPTDRLYELLEIIPARVSIVDR
ncbi:MAG: YbbR-like domain-containing protein [Gemmatimonadetes bacterium]|nr:YbbR-like domain-containing protein [Gemmatimonadota bacterium]MBT4612641.1 YbbR-like domain-containing protein [Gemmatimonadota bacterium]MBT5056030.1 YbbR-like domain-containing protein [Gemmatimonadota bacterium]MBT5143208.1 YbbR-like domain-containing protein [Gemmatimonadota bacterium]MBT5586858.1 YbbR-like domain-containing protein [Gemmatimonadota bacterium]